MNTEREGKRTTEAKVLFVSFTICVTDDQFTTHLKHFSVLPIIWETAILENETARLTAWHKGVCFTITEKDTGDNEGQQILLFRSNFRSVISTLLAVKTKVKESTFHRQNNIKIDHTHKYTHTHNQDYGGSGMKCFFSLLKIKESKMKLDLVVIDSLGKWWHGATRNTLVL